MNGALYAVVSGSLAAIERLEIAANNLANSNTGAFKAQYLVMRSLSAEDIQADGGDQTSGETLDGTTVTDVYQTLTDMAQGPIRESGNPLDVAISGPGFFVVTTPEGQRYTRQGQFHLDGTGALVTAGGYPVQGDSGEEIQLPPGTIEIGVDGGIAVDGVRTSTLRVVRFADPEELRPEGAALFSRGPDATPVGTDPADTQVIQGSIEDSNVDVIKGLLELIDVARGYEAYMRAMQQVDSSMGTAIQQVGGTA